ncbi:hypothetical protein N868_14605 [Cellulomonas carbonis T26]|uniref:Uncharacterized protein n=1 Tax=Cellulomonas carbonis T26 TaxID=947969 RepID=A0A0A0BPV2_9CELL|nr:hypothetical protein N868_14605 [Cellulomonas carbonis T26]
MAAAVTAAALGVSLMGCTGAPADGAAADLAPGVAATAAPSDEEAPADGLGAAQETDDTADDTGDDTGDDPAAGNEGATAAEDAGGSEVGELVPDFPVDLLPLPDDAVILVTSAVPVGEATDVQEVSLNLRTGLSVDDVVQLYRDALVSAGFTEAEPAGLPTELAAEATFTRSGGDELVSVGVLEVDGGRTVTIGGRVRAGR